VVYADGGDVFAGYECIKGLAYGNAVSRVKCALLSVAYAIVLTICAVLCPSRDNCAHICCVDYLSLHNSSA